MTASLVSAKCRRLAALAAGALMIAAFGVTPAYAVEFDGYFELDGNVTDSNGAATPPDDWALFPNAPGCLSTSAGCGSPNTTKATGIVGDPVPAVFRNGSKDIQDVSAWRFDLGSSPPKDDMLHAYAAAYTATANVAPTTTVGDLLIYFGADRASFNGTASLGFWFFKNTVRRNDANGTFVDATGAPATHAEGDVLVAFEYTNGGAVTAVRVFRWTAGALEDRGTIGVSTTAIAGVFCDPADKICGGTNGGNVSLPWNGTIQPGQFFEGGVNITKLLPGGDSCFASFMATSRSSSQPNASIKNFLLGDFPVCHLTVTKSCETAAYQSATNDVLNTVIGKVVNDGGGLLTNITLIDNPAFSTLNWYACNADGTPSGTGASPASLAAGASICYRGTHSSNTLTTSDTVTASASTGSGTISGTATATCVAPPPSPGSLDLVKSCDLDLELDSSNKLALKVNYGGSVTNNGTVTLTNVKVCEVQEISAADAGKDPCDIAGATVHTIGTMAGGAVKTYGGAYYPTTALTGAGLSALLNPGSALFKDKVGAQGTLPAILGGTLQKAIPVEANCTLCTP